MRTLGVKRSSGNFFLCFYFILFLVQIYMLAVKKLIQIKMLDLDVD